MSPSPAAASSASTIACATASPSEWPESAGSPGHSRPASHSVAVAAERVDVGSDADARQRGTGVERDRHRRERAGRDERACPFEVGGRRDLERERIACHDEHGVAGGAHQRRVVGVVAVGGAVGGIQDVATEALRRLRRRELVAVDGVQHLGLRRRA